MLDRGDVGGVIVHVRGHVSAADHVYAHDRVEQLRRLVAGSPFRGTVRIIADGAHVSASAKVHVDGRQADAHAEGMTIPVAVDRLHDRLRECIEVRGNDDDGSS